jgi:hypothetical protein
MLSLRRAPSAVHRPLAGEPLLVFPCRRRRHTSYQVDIQTWSDPTLDEIITLGKLNLEFFVKFSFKKGRKNQKNVSTVRKTFKNDRFLTKTIKKVSSCKRASKKKIASFTSPKNRGRFAPLEIQTPF